MSQHQSSAILLLLSQPSAPSPVLPAKAGIFVGSPRSPHRGAGRAAHVQRWRDRSRQRRGSGTAPARPDAGCPVMGTQPTRRRRTVPQPPRWRPAGPWPQPVSSRPHAAGAAGRVPAEALGKAPQLGRQTRSSALEGEKPAQRSHRGPAASSAGRAASCGQQRPGPTGVSPSPALRPSSNPQTTLLTENIAHMFVVSKCPFSILGRF